MKCFYHPNRDAVAQCSECHKGVCSECAHDVGGGILCPTDFHAGITQMVAHARRRVIGAWIFTGVVGSLFAIEATVFAFTPPSPGSQPLGPAALLLIPVAYFGSWSLFWGWGPTWRTFRRLVGGWGIFGSWIFILIVVAVIFELLFFSALVVGALTGVQRYLDDRRVLARAPVLRAISSWKGVMNGSTGGGSKDGTASSGGEPEIAAALFPTNAAATDFIPPPPDVAPARSVAGLAPAPFAPQAHLVPRQQRSSAIVTPIIIILLVVALAMSGAALIFARGWAGQGPASSAAVPGGGASPTNTPRSAPTIIYQNTLLSPAAEWEPDQSCFFAGDGFHVKPNLACQSPVRNLSDVDVSVQMRQISGGPTDQNGIEVRRSGDPASLYEFDIDATGGWLLKKCIRSFDNCNVLSSGNDPAIRIGVGAVNTLEIRAVGPRFSLLVNGTLVGQVYDATLAFGDVWLDTGGHAECVFTYFTASRPI